MIKDGDREDLPDLLDDQAPEPMFLPAPEIEQNTAPKRSIFQRLVDNTRAQVIAASTGIFLLGAASVISDRDPKTRPQRPDTKATSIKIPDSDIYASGNARRGLDLAVPSQIDTSNGRRSIETKTSNDAAVFIKYGAVPSLSREKIMLAHGSISNAMENIKANKKITKKMDKYGIKLRDPSFYLAIAIKESSLDPNAGEGNYKGYFQLRLRAEDPEKDRSPLKDVENIFGITSNNDDLSDPDKNSLLGILYFHLCRDKYLTQSVPDTDKDLAAYFAYNVGQGDFDRIWDAVHATSYEDFEKKLSKLLAKEDPKKLKYNEHPYFDKTYGVSYKTHLELVDNGRKFGKIVIGNNEFDVGKLFRALRYVRTIDSLENLPNK